MRYITLSLDCEEITCGKCQFMTGYTGFPVCNLFKKALCAMKDSLSNQVLGLGRVVACLEADVLAREELKAIK